MEPHTTTDDFYDTIEPDDHRESYRDAAMHLLPIIESGIAHCLAAQSYSVGRAQIKYALGIECRPMRDVAASLRVSVACISRGARAFAKSNNLPIPPGLKSESASKSYSNARKRQLTP